MLRIITLLEQKNHYLEKFYSLNENELLNFANGQYGHLDEFYQHRESILNMIRYIDGELEKVHHEADGVNADQKRRIAENLAIKEEYVNRILAQDLEILACIESEKSSIIRELQEIRRTKKAVGSYKSRSTQRRLDEEA